jgi:uncharacterized protein DUF5947
MLTDDASRFNAEIEALTAAVDASSDAETRDCAKELVARVLEFHAAALKRMLEIVRTLPVGDFGERLVADPLVASLFALHDLAPVDRTPLLQIARRPARDDPDQTGHDGRCERCGGPLTDTHRHLVDIATRRLSCTCRACWLLSSSDTRTTRRPVPDRVVPAPDLQVSDPQWDTLQIPVGMAFFMVNSVIGRTIAFYPSPAGATESALALEAWNDVVAANPWIRSAAPDVEAVLVRRNRNANDTVASLIVPIDACYELVGRIRIHWSGFDGGERVRAEIDRFFAEVAARSVSPQRVTAPT